MKTRTKDIFIACCCIVLLVLLVMIAHRSQKQVGSVTDWTYPPPHWGITNPAITQSTIKDTICNKKWSTRSIRPPSSYTTALKIKQLKEWNYPDQKTANYEEDHFISLELGGSPNDPRNLWPEPYNIPFGARQKDEVENYLHEQVCSGAMTLKEAQNEIVVNWVNVYESIK